MSGMHGFVGEDEKAVDYSMLRRLWAKARPWRRDLLLAAFLLLLVTLGEQAKPLLVKIIIDDHIAKGDFAGIPFWGAVFLGSVVWVFTLTAWQGLQTKAMGQSLVLSLRREIFAKIHAQPLRWFDKNPVGGMMTRVIHDVEALNQLFTAGVSAVFNDLFTLVVASVLLLAMDWRLGLVALSLLPVLAWCTALFRGKARQNFRALRANTSKMNAYLSESLAGISTLQVFGAGPSRSQGFETHNREGLRLLLNQVKINSLFLPLAAVLSALAVALALVYGGSRVAEGSLGLGVLVATVMLIQRFFEPLRDLAEKFGILQAAMASSERIFALLDRKEEVEDSAHAVSAPKLQGKVEFDDVWFAYDTEPAPRWILKGVTFEAKPGERLAVVGPTGAGKTSLLNVLYRFYPLQKGEVLFDGHDFREFTRKSLRRQMALVPQDPFLFSGSILENVRLSDPEIPEGKVEWACRQTRAHAFIEKLPGGYQHEIKEGGANLSTGQKQLLAFARALAVDPAVLILDEATSSVDTGTEELIQQALETLLRGRTSITIAHRLSTVLNADQILVMKDGEIAERGRHEELMRLGGLYKSLVELQFKEVA